MMLQLTIQVPARSFATEDEALLMLRQAALTGTGVTITNASGQNCDVDLVEVADVAAVAAIKEVLHEALS
jgi:hypothetical protein